MGIDLIRWLKEDLVDNLVGGAIYNLNLGITGLHWRRNLMFQPMPVLDVPNPFGKRTAMREQS